MLSNFQGYLDLKKIFFTKFHIFLTNSSISYLFIAEKTFDLDKKYALGDFSNSKTLQENGYFGLTWR